MSIPFLKLRALTAFLFASLATFSVAATDSVAASRAIFKHPTALAIDSSNNLWIANSDYFGITELNATTGAVERIINSRADGFIDPIGIATSEGHIWVVSGGYTYANGQNKYGMVSELDATSGALIRKIDLAKRGVTGLSSVTVVSGRVWISASGGNQLVELSESTGSVLHIFQSHSRFAMPSGISGYGTKVWIANPGWLGRVYARDAQSGKAFRGVTPLVTYKTPATVSGYSTDSLQPSQILADANYVWTGNHAGQTLRSMSSVTQLSAATGRVIRTFGSPRTGFNGPIESIAQESNHLWVLIGIWYKHGRHGGTLTEVNKLTDSTMQIIPINDGRYTYPCGVVAASGKVWVADSSGGQTGMGLISMINGATGKIIRTFS